MKLLNRWTVSLPALLLALLLVGCNTQKQHDQWVDEGNQRWYSLKSEIALQMAEDQFNSGQLKLAQKTIEDAMVNDMENPGLWLMGGRIALEESKLESAFNRMDMAIQYGEELENYPRKQKAKPHYYQGIVNQRWQRYEKAKDSYTRAYERDPEDVSYLLARVEMMIELDELQHAVAELEQKATYFDQNATVRALLGHVHRRLGDHESAAMWFKQASMLASEDMKLREEVARSQFDTGRYKQAINGLDTLTEDEYGKTRADLYRLKAKAYMALEKLHDARSVYAQVTRMDPTSPDDWAKLGELSYRLDELGAALQAANRLINLSPDHYRGYLLAGMVWNQRDRLDRALSMFDRAAELAPDNTMPRIMRGMALQKSGKPGAAADAYRQALEINPNDQRARHLLSSVTDGLR